MGSKGTIDKLNEILFSVMMARNIVISALNDYKDIRETRFSDDLVLPSRSDINLQTALMYLNAVVSFAEYELYELEMDKYE